MISRHFESKPDALFYFCAQLFILCDLFCPELMRLASAKEKVLCFLSGGLRIAGDEPHPHPV